MSSFELRNPMGEAGFRAVRYHSFRPDRSRRARLSIGEASLSVPGVECVAVADLYDARHQAAREYAQKALPATRNFHEALNRKD
jgi:hypothetical protein